MIAVIADLLGNQERHGRAELRDARDLTQVVALQIDQVVEVQRRIGMRADLSLRAGEAVQLVRNRGDARERADAQELACW